MIKGGIIGMLCAVVIVWLVNGCGYYPYKEYVEEKRRLLEYYGEVKITWIDGLLWTTSIGDIEFEKNEKTVQVTNCYFTYKKPSIGDVVIFKVSYWNYGDGLFGGVNVYNVNKTVID